MLGGSGEDADVRNTRMSGDRKLPSVSVLWGTTAVVPRVKPNTYVPKVGTSGGVSAEVSQLPSQQEGKVL